MAHQRSDSNTGILYLITGSGFGGTESSVMRLATGMKARGYRVSVCSIKRPGFMAGRMRQRGINVKSLGLPDHIGSAYPFFFPRALLRWRQLLWQERPDIIHSFLFQANALAALSRPFIKQPAAFISSVRCMEREKPAWRIFLDRWALSKSDLIIAVSRAVMRIYTEREKVPCDKIKVVYHGVEPGFLEAKPSSVNLRESIGAEEGEMVIGTVARLHADKGLETLIEAAALLQNRGQNMRVLIVGDGPESNKLKRLAERLDLAAKVFFAGFQSDVLPWISAMDLFCLTSKEEGFPQALLEAMALGMPCIATDIGGVSEVIENGKNGLLIPTDDPNALSAILIRLLEDYDKALLIGQQGREGIREGFLLQHTLDQMEDIYHDCLKERSIYDKSLDDSTF